MERIFLVPMALLALVVAAKVMTQEQVTTPPLTGSAAGIGGELGAEIPAIDSAFKAFEQPGAPGCALAVARDGKLIYSRGYGYANLDHDIPVTRETVFDVGSVTKQFTAACLCMLVLEGRVTLDDHVRQWLPE